MIESIVFGVLWLLALCIGTPIVLQLAAWLATAATAAAAVKKRVLASVLGSFGLVTLISALVLAITSIVQIVVNVIALVESVS